MLLVCAPTQFTINALVSLPTSSSPNTAPSSAAPPPTSSLSSIASQTGTPPTDSGSQSLSTGAIVGIAIGSALGLVNVCLVAYWVYKIRTGHKRANGDSGVAPLENVTQGPPSGEGKGQEHNSTSHNSRSFPAATGISNNEREIGFSQSTVLFHTSPRARKFK